MADKEKNKFAGILIGPIVVALATAALWKNEGRFDYHRAAQRTETIAAPKDGNAGQLISYTDAMDQGLTLPGEYVESMVGYLTVEREAEIYAWDRDEDDDGVTWSLRWMSRVENNSRNTGVRQQLSSSRFRPREYAVGAMAIDVNRIEFVDAYQSLPPQSLTLSDKAKGINLQRRDAHYYLSKSQSNNLGDERISYRGIRVPETATYFGKLGSGRGVSHQAERKDSFLDAWILDTGVLHHLVAGDRVTALRTMKQHLARLKWIVRGIGAACTVLGFAILFGSVVGFLYHIPLVGRLAQWGVLLLSLVLGLSLAVATILTSYLVNHPLVLIGLLALLVLVFYFARKRGKSSQQSWKRDLDQERGHEVSRTELNELKFLELARVALSDTKLDAREKSYLQTWSKKHGWGEAKFDQMLSQAKNSLDAPLAAASSAQHLRNLIRLSLADDNLKSYELKSIQLASKDLGYDRATLQRLINQIRHERTRPS